jgi:hypothetical protein
MTAAKCFLPFIVLDRSCCPPSFINRTIVLHLHTLDDLSFDNGQLPVYGHSLGNNLYRSRGLVVGATL